MPDGVEAACYRYKRVPEGVTHPDSEHCVLLAECLTGFDAAAVPASGTSAYCELEYAAQHGDNGNADKGEYVAAAVDDGAGAHKDGKRKRYAPQVETQIDFGGNPMVEPWHYPADGPCGKAGEYKQREYLGKDAAECGNEGYSGLRIQQGDGQGYQNRYRQVDDYGVHYHLRHITSQLSGYDRACSGCRAYHAEHSGLKQYAVPQYPGGRGRCAVHCPYYREAQGKEREYLYGQVAYVPPLELD